VPLTFDDRITIRPGEHGITKRVAILKILKDFIRIYYKNYTIAQFPLNGY